eukprot:scaffold265931_cov29-Tisochrysis_lutea.AAC.4
MEDHEPLEGVAPRVRACGNPPLKRSTPLYDPAVLLMRRPSAATRLGTSGRMPTAHQRFVVESAAFAVSKRHLRQTRSLCDP